LTYVFCSIRISLNLKLNIRKPPVPLPWREGIKGRGDHPHLHPPPSRGRRLMVVFPDGHELGKYRETPFFYPDEDNFKFELNPHISRI
jgi:hypothetical protein